jgi:hypothetical protein
MDHALALGVVPGDLRARAVPLRERELRKLDLMLPHYLRSHSSACTVRDR